MSKRRILIVDDEDDIRTVVRAALASKYEVVEARDGLDALEKLELAEPDFVVLDVMMPLMDGIQTCAAIRRHPKFKHLSVLFLSALNSRDDMMKGYGAGANLYLTKPFDPSRLLRNVDVFFETNPVPFERKKFTLEELQALERTGPSALAQAKAAPAPDQAHSAAAAGNHAAPPVATATPDTGNRFAQPAEGGRPRVLVVDDDAEMRTLLTAILEPHFETYSAADGIVAIERITTYQPDIIILDAMMPKMSGYQLCQSLRRNVRFSKTPILFVSAKSSPRDREYALRIGGQDFLAKPFNPEELEKKVQGLTQHPNFVLHPKALNREQIRDVENRRKKELEEHQDRLHRKEESELEKFLREHS